MNLQGTKPLADGHRLLLLLILLAAFALRCAALDSQELRGDEAFGYFFSLATPSEIVEQTLELEEPHPVASYWLQHWWLSWAGDSEFALRYTGVWFSVVAVALIVSLAAQLGFPTVAVIVAALLMACSPYAIWHAQDARMYSMSLALTMASTLLAILWWQGGGDKKQLSISLSYLVVTWLALQTHYFAAYIVLAQNVGLGGWAIAARSWRKWGLWLLLGLLVLLAWTPWLVAASSILMDYHGNGDSPGIVSALIRAHSSFGFGDSWSLEARRWGALLVLVAMALGVFALWKAPKEGSRRALWFLIVYWLTPLVVTWLSAQNRPIFNERYLVAAVPPVYLLISAAVISRTGEEKGRYLLWTGRFLAGCIVVGMLWSVFRQATDPELSKSRGWRELAATLQRLTSASDPAQTRLVQNYPDPTLWYYYRGDVPHLVLPPAANDVARSSSEVARLVDAGVVRVVLVEQPDVSWDGDSIARSALVEGFEMAGATMVDNWPISLWLRPPLQSEPIGVQYQNGLQLDGAEVQPRYLLPGGVLEVYLRWQQLVDSSAKNGGSVGVALSLQLINDAGELVAQLDHTLDETILPTGKTESYAILVPEDLPLGEYQLYAIVYDPMVAGTPRWLTNDGQDRVLLSNVEVVETARSP